MCREAAWAEQTAEVTFGVVVRRNVRGLFICMIRAARRVKKRLSLRLMDPDKRFLISAAVIQRFFPFLTGCQPSLLPQYDSKFLCFLTAGGQRLDDRASEPALLQNTDAFDGRSAG